MAQNINYNRLYNVPPAAGPVTLNQVAYGTGAGITSSANFNYTSEKLTISRSTIGGSLLLNNNAYSLGGEAPLSINDGQGFNLGLGYSSINPVHIKANANSLYLMAPNTVYGVFIGTSNLHVNGKIRVGDDGFNTGHTAEIVGDIQITSQAGVSDRIVEADFSGVQSATKEIISAFVNDLLAIAEIENGSNWGMTGNWLGTISNTYQGQEHYDSSYFYKLIGDNNPIRLIRG